MKTEYEEIIKDYLNENPDKNDTDLADLILEDRVIDKSHRTIRRYIIEGRGGVSSLELRRSQDPDDSDPEPVPPTISTSVDIPIPKALTVADEDYTISDNKYTIKYAKETFVLDVDDVDKIFCSYSKKGLNYPGPSVMSVLEIDKKAFSALVSKAGLTKESDPLGPYTMETLSALDRRDKIATLTSTLLETYAEADSGVAESIVKEFKKKYSDLVFNTNQKNEVYSHIIDKLPQISVRRYKDSADPVRTEPLYVVIGDMHIGLETKAFNVEKAREALRDMSNTVNKKVVESNYSDVYLIFLGDLPHTVSGINHMNSWKDIEPGLWGAEAIIKPYELIAEFITNTMNITKVFGVGGNHGRLHNNKDLEPTDEGEKLIFYMIQNTFKSQLEVVWDPDRVIFTKGKLTFVVLHGDQGQDKKPGQDIAWHLGSNGTYNLILVGHTHSRQINKNDDGDGFRKMVCPPFCPTDSYAERLGYESLPGFLLIEEDSHGFPIITDHPLFYAKN